MIRKVLVTAALALGAAGCASAGSPTAAATPNPPPIATSPGPSPTQSPSPSASAAVAPAAQARSMPVTLTGLPAGSYATHLHSVCSGAQSFHITVLQTLVVAASGTGTIQVPSGDFGRGLCVIVYATPSLSRVLATRRI